MSEMIHQSEVTATAVQPPSIMTASRVGPTLEDLVRETDLCRPGTSLQLDRGQALLKALVDDALKGSIRVDQGLERGLRGRIADIDALISDQLGEILHHPDFQALEGSWRGLSQLVSTVETGQNLQIRLLHATKKEILNDARRAPEFDQSGLFKKIYEGHYGVFGGTPFGLLVGDFEFGNSPEDIELLEALAGVAAAAHAPFISAASPGMFNLESFTELGRPRDLARIFSTADYLQWREFRASEDSRYVALTLPRYLARLPYGARTRPVEGFDFEEDVDGRDHSKYLWSNAAYLLAQRVASAFSLYGWSTAIRGAEGGGLVSNLPTHTFDTDAGEIAMKVPTEVQIGDRRERELSDLGFVGLVHQQGSSSAAFFGGQTTNLPKAYNDDAATANAQLSARLPYLLAVSRIAHYLKSIVRDKIGGFASPTELEAYLNRWISQYVLLMEDAPLKKKAEKPLRAARIVVEEDPRYPGSYRARAFLRPHFQLEDVKMSLHLVAKLPGGKA